MHRLVGLREVVDGCQRHALLDHQALQLLDRRVALHGSLKTAINHESHRCRRPKVAGKSEQRMHWTWVVVGCCSDVVRCRCDERKFERHRNSNPQPPTSNAFAVPMSCGVGVTSENSSGGKEVRCFGVSVATRRRRRRLRSTSQSLARPSAPTPPSTSQPTDKAEREIERDSER